MIRKTHESLDKHPYPQLLLFNLQTGVLDNLAVLL